MSTLDMNFIFTEILPLIPIKTLICFKCVSKSFKSFISSPGFTRLLFHPSQGDLLILPGTGSCSINCYDLDSHPLSATPKITFSWDDYPSIKAVRVVGSCNGLLLILCQSKGVNYLTVLNSLTKNCRYIDIPYKGLDYLNVGFAFDHENLDFKIVVVSTDRTVSANLVTWVYSLNADTWRKLENDFGNDSVLALHGGGSLINNHLLHWLFWSPTLYRKRLECFDVCKNEWIYDDLLPPGYYDPANGNHIKEIGVFDDHLFFLLNGRDVWVMEEYGVYDSWSKLLNILLSKDLGSSDVIIPVAFHPRCDDAILVKQHDGSMFYWYNTVNGGTSEAKFPGAVIYSDCQVYMCSCTLVDVPYCKQFGKLYELLD